MFFWPKPWPMNSHPRSSAARAIGSEHGLYFLRVATKKGPGMRLPRPFIAADGATNLEGVPDAQLSLTRESAAAIKIRQHEEGIRDPGVSVRTAAGDIHRIDEVRAVGDVVDVQEDLQRVPPCDLAPPACPNVGLEVIGPSRTVAPTVELHIVHRVREGAAVGSRRHGIVELAVSIDVD